MYITQNIPVIGGLASQIQQYASLYAIAKRTNKKIVFLESMKNSPVGFQFNRLLDINIDFIPDSEFTNYIEIEPAWNKVIDENCFNLKDGVNYYFKNRFDLYHYWYDYKDDIFNWNWNSEFYSKSLDTYKQYKRDDIETVSIHIRRGDYLLPQHHHFSELGIDYYSPAIDNFRDDKNYNFLIFSNDMFYAKSLFGDGDNVFYIEPGETDYGWSAPSDKGISDLILMSLCDHNIIANSSFSIWAAMMNRNKNKKVVCPMNYLKQYSPFNHINKNYYPPEWISIDNK